MNKTQELYMGAMNVVHQSDAFEYKDHISPAGGTYRIFSYRLASYSDFLIPYATESRGTMFLMDSTNPEQAVSIASRTPTKFFNAFENPSTMFGKDITFDSIQLVMDKLDGSLISTFMDVDNIVRTKSHSSLSSDHAINSTKILQNHTMYNEVIALVNLGFTVNFEYTSPVYRIVLPYSKDSITVLNVRHNESGEYMSINDMKKFSVLFEHSIFAKSGEIDPLFPREGSMLDICKNVKENFRNMEGFVVMLKTGQYFKIKTDWYCNLHYNKESITIPSRLFTIVLNEQSDDLRQLFYDDELSLSHIKIMENIVSTCYNSIRKDVNEFVRKHGHLDQKSFAHLVLQEPSDMGRHSLIFCLYNGKQPQYKEMLTKHMRVLIATYISAIQG